MRRGSDVDESKRATLRRFAALGAASPLVGLVDGREEGEGSEVREAIAGYLAATPGAHFSKVRDDLKLGTGEAQYHLRQLVDAGAVESYKDGDYRRFFPGERFSSFEKVALGYLRRETPRGMLVELLADPGVTAGELADRLDVSRATVSKYAGELEEVGLLSREDGYAVERPETVLVLVVRYADSFDARAVRVAAEADELLSYSASDG
ncbi:MarR family transcriptional regulator [Halobacteriales archaeon QS_1_68_20]|nr:MAG: MarR family transcriptional regulator [Halobacteriales archaeon QS_1_68_20]